MPVDRDVRGELSAPGRLDYVRQVTSLAHDRRHLFGVDGGFGAEMKGPGHVHHNGMEAINLAELKGVGVAELEVATTDNFFRLFAKAQAPAMSP